LNNFLGRFYSSWRGSTLQVIAAIVLPLTLLLVAVSFGSFFIHQNAMRSLVGERDERAVRAAASAIGSEVDHRVETLRGQALLARDGSKENLTQVLEDSNYLRDNFDLGLAFFSQNGELLTYSGDKSIWEAASGQIDLSTVQTPGSAGVNTLIIDGKPVVLISSSAPNGNVVTVGAFSATNILQGVLEKDFPENGIAAVYVFDPAYRILYQSGPGTIEGDPSQHPGIPDALNGKSGTTYVQAGSDEHVLAYSPIPATSWAIVVEESWEAVANPTLQTSQITPMILVPALLLAMLALWFGAEQIVKPLRSLEAKAAKLAWGDFTEIEQPVHGIAEIITCNRAGAHGAQVQIAQQSLHTYIGAITQGQEDERQRLARELHDDTIQSLIALKQRAQLTRRALPKDTSPQTLIELESLTEETIENLRRTIRALRPIYLEDLGLVAALEMLSNETGQNSDLRVYFQSTGHERRLAADVELALYRMAQEALNNAVRHAKASQASLNIEFTAQSVSVSIHDNGVGFDVPKSPTEFAPGRHFGLVVLYERAQLIGAELEIKSAPGMGTQLSICLPTKHKF
jgi:signal transduction histidine kinase